ncbi:MAG: type II toxin-antitoxin system VapC family toxin [Planctomycetota bacterium]
MAAKRMVIDACVAAKWFLGDEADADVALDVYVAFLAGELDLHAPRLFIYEFAHVLSKACLTRKRGAREFRLDWETALECVATLFALLADGSAKRTNEAKITMSDANKEEACEALKMAVRFSRLHGDMVYLRLAEVLDCQWCTADEKVLSGGIPPGFPEQRIVLLSSMRQ